MQYNTRVIEFLVFIFWQKKIKYPILKETNSHSTFFVNDWYSSIAYLFITVDNL